MCCAARGTGLPDALARSLAGTLEVMAAMQQGGYPVEIDLALPSVTLPRPRAPPSMKCTTPSCATRNRRMRPLEQPASPTRLPRGRPPQGRLPQGRPHGCVHGALAGTAASVFIVPHMDSIASLLALVSIAAALSAWIAVGRRPSPTRASRSPSPSSCASSSRPGFDLTIARDRTIGILLGNMVVYLIFTRVWPVSIAASVDRAMTALRAMARGRGRRRGAPCPWPPRRWPPAATRSDSSLTAYEPAWLRPPQAWQDARRDTLAALSATAAPLVLAAAPGDAARAPARGLASPPSPPAGHAGRRGAARLASADRRRRARAVAGPSTEPTQEAPAHAPA